MLSLVLHPDQLQQLADELARARDQEIGGVLVGEQIKPDTFRLVDLSVQRSGGTQTCFICDPAQHESFLNDFFARTGQDFSRFNYLGEWHSHPRFTVAPSPRDLRQMQDLVSEGPAIRSFALLLVVRLAGRARVELCPLVFRGQFRPQPVDVTIGPRPRGERVRTRSWFGRLLSGAAPPELVVARVPDDASFEGMEG